MADNFLPKNITQLIKNLITILLVKFNKNMKLYPDMCNFNA